VWVEAVRLRTFNRTFKSAPASAGALLASVIPGLGRAESPESMNPESMNTGLWKMDSGFTATRAPE